MKIPEVARLLGKPEKTIRYWITHKKLPARLVNGQYEIEASDLPVIPEEPPGIDSLITRIEGLERKLEDAQEYAFSSHSDYAHVSGLLYALEQRLEGLEREVKALHDLLAVHMASHTPAPAQPKILRPAPAPYDAGTSGALPDGLVALRDFYHERHKVPETTVNRAVTSGALPVVTGKWKRGNTYITKALDAFGRARFYELYHLRSDFQRCDECPHRLESESISNDESS